MKRIQTEVFETVFNLILPAIPMALVVGILKALIGTGVL